MWVPLTAENVVSMLRDSCEHAVMDFKTTYDVSDPLTAYEVAKDVAAFANRLGGTIVVGVVE
jgi:hypothetical protein